MNPAFLLSEGETFANCVIMYDGFSLESTTTLLFKEVALLYGTMLFHLPQEITWNTDTPQMLLGYEMHKPPCDNKIPNRNLVKNFFAAGYKYCN